MVRRHITDDRRRQELCLIIVQERKCLLMPQRESDSSRTCHHYSDTLIVHGPRLGCRGAGVSDNEAAFSSAHVQMSLCRSALHFALQLSVFGNVCGALIVAPVL